MKWGTSSGRSTSPAETRLQDELARLVPDGSKPDALERLARFLTNVAEAWTVADQEQRNRLARALFEEIWVKDKKVVAVVPRPELEPFFALRHARDDKDGLKKIFGNWRPRRASNPRSDLARSCPSLARTCFCSVKLFALRLRICVPTSACALLAQPQRVRAALARADLGRRGRSASGKRYGPEQCTAAGRASPADGSRRCDLGPPCRPNAHSCQPSVPRPLSAPEMRLGARHQKKGRCPDVDPGSWPLKLARSMLSACFGLCQGKSVIRLARSRLSRRCGRIGNAENIRSRCMPVGNI